MDSFKLSLLCRTVMSKLHWSIVVGLLCAAAQRAPSQSNGPVLVDPDLVLTTVVTNLEVPTSMAFLRRNDFLVLEKASGRVQRVTNGTVTTVLDLPVNSASERGLLGIALHPRFPRNPSVYLYWTESSTGADSAELADVPLLGNRVDRFHWDGSTLTMETNIIRLRSFQMDEGQPLRGNHDGGIIRFGPDGKLYIYIGDNGRRGQMQNLPDGPSRAGNTPDDQFGGPEPDNAHLTGVILRLNDDGTTPRDNPFYRAGALRGGEAGTNLAKVFAYGIRNGFGMAFDPISGQLWEAQNGDDSFTEINQVGAGFNLGWVQVMGPLARIAQFKEIETSTNFFGLQQIRWSPTNIADTAEEAISRLFWVYEGGNRFGARMVGSQEVPPVTTDSRAVARFALNQDGTLSYELRATGPITNATQAHIHLGARTQNGPVVAFLLGMTPGTNFESGDLIASGTLTDADVIGQPGFTATITNLVERMRQGRAYANLHTVAFQAGEIRGQISVTDRAPVSRYSDPEFSWKFEVAPAGIGFVNTLSLGPKYYGDMLVGAARDFLQGGTLFRFNMRWAQRSDFHHDGDNEDDDEDNDGDGRWDRRHSWSRLGRTLSFDDPRLNDRVADNLDKFDITESESLLFGTNFGVVTDIHTGPDGKVYLVSLSNGAVYSIGGPKPSRNHNGDNNDDDDDDRGENNNRGSRYSHD
jgi:glucose/arabinose dehydrogenase